MMTNIVGIDPEHIRVGMAVEVVFEDISPEISLPRFRPTEASEPHQREPGKAERKGRSSFKNPRRLNETGTLKSFFSSSQAPGCVMKNDSMVIHD